MDGQQVAVSPSPLTRAGSMRRISRPLQSPVGPRMRSSSSSGLARVSVPVNNDPQSSRDSNMTLINSALPESSEDKLSSIDESHPTTNSHPMGDAFETSSASSRISIKPAVPGPRISIPPLPSISFDAPVLQWKGLPLEAAVWTLESQDLQEIVSRSIRSSSKEQFIRLLTLDLLDHILPSEIESLHSRKMVAQSKYRFLTQRRQMLLQALSSVSGAPQQDGGTMADLVTQLSEVCCNCDATMVDLLHISDKLGQIHKLIETHSASALAIALRKLNKSYGKRTEELIEANTRISGLTATLEDAWKEAERLAKILNEREREAAEAAAELAELDDLTSSLDPESDTGFAQETEDVTTSTRLNLDTGSLIDDETGIIHTVQVVSVATHSRSQSLASQEFLSPRRSGDEVLPATTAPKQPQISPQVFSLPPDTTDSPPTQILETAPASQTALPPSSQAFPRYSSQTTMRPTDDSASIKSSHTARSVKSTKSRSTNISTRDHVAELASARRRSIRKSEGSLRLPQRTIIMEEPPLPELPTSLHPVRSNKNRNGGNRAGSIDSSLYNPTSTSFINFDMGTTDEQARASGIGASLGLGFGNKFSLGSLRVLSTAGSIHSSGAPSGRNTPSITVDDIHVTPRSPREEREIQEAPRSISRRPVDDVVVRRHAKNESMGGGTSIPSIWIHADAPAPPKTPAERVQSLLRSQSQTKTSSSYSKLKSFTKKYSFVSSLPLFHKANPEAQSSAPSALYRDSIAE